MENIDYYKNILYKNKQLIACYKTLINNLLKENEIIQEQINVFENNNFQFELNLT